MSERTPFLFLLSAQQVSALSNIAYSAVPTIESITQDNMLGNFNVCVDGLRARVDWRVNDALLVYGQGIFSISKGEQNQTCDRHGNLPSATASEVDYVADGLLGEQYEFEGKRSHLYATVGARQDSLGAAIGGATTFIQQFEVTYNFSKTIANRETSSNRSATRSTSHNSDL